MSRTYRRKNVPYWYTLDEALTIQHKYVGKWSHCEKEEDYWLEVKRFHSDAAITMQQVPKWYKTHFLRRPYRAKVKHFLAKERNNGYQGITPEPIDKKRACYYW